VRSHGSVALASIHNPDRHECLTFLPTRTHPLSALTAACSSFTDLLQYYGKSPTKPPTNRWLALSTSQGYPLQRIKLVTPSGTREMALTVSHLAVKHAQMFSPGAGRILLGGEEATDAHTAASHRGLSELCQRSSSSLGTGTLLG